MPIYVGPTAWWFANSRNIGDKNNVYIGIARCCPVGTATGLGARLICKSAGVAWFVAPSCTQVSSAWAGGQYNSTAVGDKCCVSEWSTVQTALQTAGFTPSCWFVPSTSQLQNPGYVCRTNWDTFSATYYWSSTEINATFGYFVGYNNGSASNCNKSNGICIRAFRCVTY